MDSIRHSNFQSVRLKSDSSGILPQKDEEAHDHEGSKDEFEESLHPEEDLDQDEEQQEGERHESELLEKYDLWEDENTELVLDEIYHTLEPYMERREVEYDLLALEAETPFASSCPNGAIYLTRGLLEQLTRDQVLFFVAHELAHTEMRHYASRKRRLAELRQIIPAPPGSPTRRRLELAAVLSVRHQEEFEADQQAGLWVGREFGVEALTRLHEVCKLTCPASLQRPTHPPFEKRVRHLKEGIPFPPLLDYLYTLVN